MSFRLCPPDLRIKRRQRSQSPEKTLWDPRGDAPGCAYDRDVNRYAAQFPQDVEAGRGPFGYVRSGSAPSATPTGRYGVGREKGGPCLCSPLTWGAQPAEAPRHGGRRVSYTEREERQ